MSVIVKGMKMPESCYYCGFTDTSFINCLAFEKPIVLEDDCEERRPDWCPLVALPDKHGRLVEFIDVVTTLDEDSGTEEVCLGDIMRAYYEMRNAPTIVESEDSGCQNT